MPLQTVLHCFKDNMQYSRAVDCASSARLGWQAYVKMYEADIGWLVVHTIMPVVYRCIRTIRAVHLQ
jgi:hypothetical protein